MKSLCQDQVDYLHNEHYHEYKALEKQAVKPSHGLPLKDRTKEMQRFLPDKYFSDIPFNTNFEPNAKEKEEIDHKEMKK